MSARFAPADLAACGTCGERIIRRMIGGSWAAWLHEDDSAWFCDPHPAVPKAA